MSDIELLPSQVIELKKKIRSVSNSDYLNRLLMSARSIPELESATAEFARIMRSALHDIGYEVYLSTDVHDEDNWIALPNDELSWNPPVTVTGLADPGKFEHERKAIEVQEGLVDGIVGSIDRHGNKTSTVHRKKVL